MTEASTLQRLAERAGIGLGYHDIFGDYHHTSEPVLRQLLTALGALPAPEADPAEALARWEARQWQQVLEPVQVIPADAPAAVRLSLPEAELGQPLRLIVEEEQGERRAQELRPELARVVDTGEAGGERYRRLEVALPTWLPVGYHRLCLERGEEWIRECRLIATPGRCYQPPALERDGRLWGPAVQLYAVRSERNWGMGDFSDLRRLGELWGGQGANLVGLNPLHALFAANPAHASPYSPSSRRFLNVLYLDVEAVPDYAEAEAVRELVRSAEFQLRLQELRAAELVDYPGVAAAKLSVLEQLYRHFREHHLGERSRRGEEFRAFQQREGAPLRLYATYEALYEHLHRQDPGAWSWMQWPEPYRDPQGAAVAEFAAEHAERIEFFEYLQWQAELQLAAAARHLSNAGLEVGLYLDLAVSVDRGGADGWRNQALYCHGVSVGAPPDDFNRKGQDWGLPPFNPLALREAGYDPLIGALRESMRRAGALRIDHVMGLMRLFWIPEGAGAAEGAYVHYRLEEQLAVVAVESHRNRCLVIGEDLGTVPPEVPEAMQRLGILSYRVLYFEKDGEGRVKAPGEFPANALATVSTHDLPTLAGYWQGHDLNLRSEFGLYDTEEGRAALVVGRAEDRSRLLFALEREGLLPEGATVDPASVPAMTEELARKLHVYLARSPSKLMMVQPEDVLGMVEQVNFPAGPEERHPNWRRKHVLALEHWPDLGAFLHLTAALRAERPAPVSRRLAPRRTAARIPRATYRLQLNAGFTFRDAAALVPYLARLGISHVYCSPYLRARPGSQHGYDIIDHNALNPEIGSREDFEAFVQALEQHGMSQIMDVVPNHMGVMGADNQWWLDVLENGPASLYAPYFDIDWNPAKPELRGRLLVPTLGDRYGDVLERGELNLRFDPEHGEFSVWYFEHRLPVAPHEYPRLLGARLDVLELRMGAQDPRLAELQSLISAFSHLPGRHSRSSEKLLERHRDLQFHKQRLARLCAEAAEILDHIEDTVDAYNGEPGEPASFDALHELLEAQPYRLAHWHAAADEINYRRFFDIHDLAALRMEDERVFEATHQLILGLVGEGKVQGLRIDHPDGLYDPETYFARLQSAAALAGGAEGASGQPSTYLLVEKILATDEPLASDWPVHGTTGYEFLNLVNGLFVDSRAGSRLRRFYAAFTGERTPFEEQLYKAKRLIMKYALASELGVLANELNRISEADRHTRDFTLNRLRQALAEFVAWLPVYRTYRRHGRISDSDRRYIAYALGRAREGSRAEEIGVYDFLERVLLEPMAPEDPRGEAMSRFAMRLQQYTGAVMAKGLEDTSFYRYLPLVSLNEVGGDPRRFGVSIEDFHRSNRVRRRLWPHTMLASSTHDNKRSEDVRARINLLSELPALWRRHVRRWAEVNDRHKREVDGAPAPDRNDEYLLYQTLLGAWPLEPLTGASRGEFVERIQAYMLKALREAKRNTSWINRNDAYEAAVQDYVGAVLDPANRAFLEDFGVLQPRIARLGLYNSLSQVLVKNTAPGVPDLYQGNELWDFSLVDPDNRRPVDYERRDQLLARLQADWQEQGGADLARQLAAAPEDPATKLFLTWRLLRAREQHETLFRDGDYLPLASSGARAEHLCAYARRLHDSAVVAVAPRLVGSLPVEPDRPPTGAVWEETVLRLGELPAGRYTDLITGRSLEARTEGEQGPVLDLTQVLADFPVALLLAS